MSSQRTIGKQSQKNPRRRIDLKISNGKVLEKKRQDSKGIHLSHIDNKTNVLIRQARMPETCSKRIESRSNLLYSICVRGRGIAVINTVFFPPQK